MCWVGTAGRCHQSQIQSQAGTVCSQLQRQLRIQPLSWFLEGRSGMQLLHWSLCQRSPAAAKRITTCWCCQIIHFSCTPKCASLNVSYTSLRICSTMCSRAARDARTSIRLVAWLWSLFKSWQHHTYQVAALSQQHKASKQVHSTQTYDIVSYQLECTKAVKDRAPATKQTHCWTQIALQDAGGSR